MKNLSLLSALCVVVALSVAGCGKKKNETAKDHKKLAGLEAPVLRDETENLLDDKELTEFAFVDDADEVDAQALASADNVEVDNGAIALQDEDHNAAYAFKVVNFSFNKISIRKDQKPVVAEDIQTAKDVIAQGKKVVVAGNTCQIGSAAYNLALSERRAQAVKKEMVKAGLDADKIATVGYGYERPMVWSDEKDRSKLIAALSPNRRAELHAD